MADLMDKEAEAGSLLGKLMIQVDIAGVQAGCIPPQEFRN